MAPSLSELAYQALREQILDCALVPGTRLTERQAVEATGFGKTPVREALGRLAADGLVQVLPRSGYLVAPVTLHDIDEIFEAAAVLLTEVVRLAVVRNPAHAADVLRIASAELKDDYGPSAMRVFQGLAGATGNSRLVDLSGRLFDQVHRIFALAYLAAGPADWLIAGLEDLVPLVTAGNIDVVVARCEDLLRLAHEDSVRVLASAASLRSAEITITP